MKIGLLGSLYVVTREGSVRVTAGQQRTVIARLAAEPGKLVPVDALIAAVWGESPPRPRRISLRQILRSGSRLFSRSCQTMELSRHFSVSYGSGGLYVLQLLRKVDSR